MSKQEMRKEWEGLDPKYLEEVRQISIHPDVPVSQSAYARYIGTSPQYIHQLVKSGHISLTSKRKIVPRQADLARELMSMDTSSDIGDISNDLKLEHLRQKVEHETHKARRAKLKADEEEGLLIPASDVSRYVFDVGRSIRSAMEQIPIRVSAQLSGMTDAFEIQNLLDAEIESALRVLSDTFDVGKVEK